MYYLTFNKTNKVVSRICEEEIVSYTEGFELAKYYGEIPKNDYLTVTNLKEETETFVEKKEIENINDNGEVVIEEVEEIKTRNYFNCDLVANFYPPKTEEELAKEKEKQYNNMVETLIREKYSQGKVESIHSNYLKAMFDGTDLTSTKKEEYIAEFNEFQDYRFKCKEEANKEIYNK